MKSLIKKILLVLGVVFVILLGFGIHYVWRNGPVGTGFTAKILCSCVFVSGRSPDSVWSDELALPRKNLVGADIDYDNKSITASLPLWPKFKRRAIYREGLGCILLIDATDEEVRKQTAVELKPSPPGRKDLPWPTGDLIPSTELPAGIDLEKINQTLDEAFSEPDPKRPRRTRAVVILYDGHFIAERYAQGFTKDTRQHGWSMTKSVNSALVGILVKQGKLDIHKPAPVPEWQKPGDPRSAITIDQLLRMSSGLEFLEEYESNPSSDAGLMFFTAGDMAAYSANKPLEVQPDSLFSYSSGTSNILARIMRHSVEGTYADYLSFPRRALFDKLGMRSAIIEPDASGTFVGAGYMYATPRDWARFGLLYLNDGIWEGERILPEGWVKYTRTPTPNAPPHRQYGVQFWLNTAPEGRWLPKLPTDLYSARGHDGQYVTIIPSRKLVVVRMGFTPKHLKSWDHESFILNILKAIPE